MLNDKHILLGLSGGIACYKSAVLTRLLVKAGATVQVVMTEAAEHFITPVTMQALSGRTVYTSQWDARVANNMPHIDLVREADAVVIAPASTDILAKLAHGFANDLLTTLCLARSVPLLVAPAMNAEMWDKPATQRNIAQLRADDVQFLGPAAGDQACGETGMGRVLEPEEILEALGAFFQPKLLAGKRALVTAGPTYEAIDPVRGITNLSSGKMGYAIARALHATGAEVSLVSGPTALDAPLGVMRTNVVSARDMHAAVMAQATYTDLFVGVAAVVDWRVAQASPTKIKKQKGKPAPMLEMTQNPDILAEVAALPDAPYCVGFAAETDNLEAHANAKRASKGVPLLVGNLGPATFGKDDNALILFDAKGSKKLPHGGKDELAQLLVAEIAKRLS
ncbi:MAG: bifunctional phosphopantothenoylcysteine decarboxylase/phosphopantothenate--cysteine ligase CoaBC [Candidatus Protistobacter heckmanni]|nr:bifunctional phosphopantothenoylcysteine decarboxylase/phosphopantothenate--cysteine ligase CoaBC [Candidatus Protistobacter heckmanni]